MKKIVALLLTLVILSSLSLIAFAAGEQYGTTTITAKVPDPSDCSYTINIPADMTLEYGNTEKQTIGTATVSDVVNLPSDKWINCHVDFEDLKSESGTETIPVKYFANGSEENELYYTVLYDYEDDGTPSIGTLRLEAQVSEWASATPGTYTAKIIFYFDVED